MNTYHSDDLYGTLNIFKRIYIKFLVVLIYLLYYMLKKDYLVPEFSIYQLPKPKSKDHLSIVSEDDQEPLQ
jgi:hypothetical protein